MKLSFQNAETIGVISWLLMDFCWSSGYMVLAWIFSLVALFFSIVAVISYDGKNKSEHYLLAASWMWVMMNSHWMWSEYLGINWLLWAAKVYFLVTIVLIIMYIKASKKEGNKVELKRLKLK